MSRLTVGQRVWIAPIGCTSGFRPLTVTAVGRVWATVDRQIRVTAEPVSTTGYHGRDRGRGYSPDRVYTDAEYVRRVQMDRLSEPRRKACDALSNAATLDPATVVAVCRLLQIPCPSLPADGDVLAELLSALK